MPDILNIQTNSPHLLTPLSAASLHIVTLFFSCITLLKVSTLSTGVDIMSTPLTPLPRPHQTQGVDMSTPNSLSKNARKRHITVDNCRQLSTHPMPVYRP